MLHNYENCDKKHTRLWQKKLEGIIIGNSDSNIISYVICELLINTILKHNEVYEIKYGNDKTKTRVYQMEFQLLETKL